MGTAAYRKYPRSSDFGGRKVLNVGCGSIQWPAPNVVNLDKYANCNPNVIHDLNETPYPFEDETFDLVIANHVMEHVENWWAAFNECARVCKVGGTVEVWVPGVDTDSSFGYRDHIHRINSMSFFGVKGTYRAKSNAWAVENLKCHANRLEMKPLKIMLDDNFLNHMPQFVRQWAWKHLRNVTLEVGYIFTKISESEYVKEMGRYDAIPTY